MVAILKDVSFIRVEVPGTVTQVVGERVLLNKVKTLTTKVGVTCGDDTVNFDMLKNNTTTKVKHEIENHYGYKIKLHV